MLVKEYRICMPITVEEYKKGQQYMINRHSDEQSVNGEGVEVVCNRLHHDEHLGDGKYTEKRIHLNARLPSWARSIVPSIYIIEKAWNYYPYTFTEYTCPFLPRLLIFIETTYENNNGKEKKDQTFIKANEHVNNNELENREIVHLDIAFDKVPEKSYKANEDCTKFKSIKTGRGPLKAGWRDTHTPIMCSYKLILAKFEMWGLQNKIETFIQRSIRDILLLGHRQAFAWVDQWYDMSLDNIMEYELALQEKTNKKVMGKRKKEGSSTSSQGQSSKLEQTNKTAQEDEDDDIFEDAVSA